MGGLRSRRKGIRVEYKVRDHLRELGYEAHRVPASGASQGFKGDILATKGGRSYIFEVKGWSKGFEGFYFLHSLFKNQNGTVCFCLNNPLEGQRLVAFGTSLTDVLYPVTKFYKIEESDLYYKLYKRVLKKESLLGAADILVLKGDHKPPLFFKFW